MIGITTFPRLYRDSVTLMALASRLEKLESVERAGVMMATPANLAILAEAGLIDGGDSWAPDDLVVAVRAASQEALAEAEQIARQALGGEGGAEGSSAQSPAPGSIPEALAAGFDATLACVSVPGAYASSVVEDALTAGLHVFCFSDNVTVEDEVRLKLLARERGLLLMGPDCGTAMIDGVGLGFVNEVRRGPVGLVSASGTGAQEVACLLDHAGVGVAQILGVGGRDLSAEVGARMTFSALELLAADPDVGIIVVVSKPPAREVAGQVVARLADLATPDRPVVACLLGAADAGQAGTDPLLIRGSLESAAVAAARAAGADVSAGPPVRTTPAADPHHDIIGLFTGGTLAGEARLILTGAGITAEIHDLGDDQYTRGRPHPMIDPTPRAEWIGSLAERDPGVLLVDVVLGHGSHPDPAGELVGAVAALRAANPAASAWQVVAAVTGTERDPQHLSSQLDRLTDAGIGAHLSTAAAARAAATLALGGTA